MEVPRDEIWKNIPTKLVVKSLIKWKNSQVLMKNRFDTLNIFEQRSTSMEVELIGDSPTALFLSLTWFLSSGLAHWNFRRTEEPLGDSPSGLGDH
uniref:Uncharacterized protein n=1 Tax=Solanum tuberosum TaxID=4113 RepID=M1D986_SOLTU